MAFARTSLFLGLLAGTASASLFLLILSVSASAIFLFLPSLPLFGLGLRGFTRPLLHAAALATALIFVLTGLSGALTFLAIIAAPVLLIAPQIINGAPIGSVLADLAIYAALVTAGVCLHLIQNNEAGLSALLMQQMRDSIANLNPEMAVAMQDAVERFGFVLVGIANWFWLALLYLHTIIANAFLKNAKVAMRPSLRIAYFEPPITLLAALVGVATFSFLTEGDFSFISRACSVILLFPYFLLGLSLVQAKMLRLPAAGILLFLLYFTIFALLWPAFVIAGLGLWQHCKRLAHTG